MQKAQVKFGECSWLGLGFWDEEDRVATIEEVVFPHQENGQATSDIDDAALADIILECYERELEILWWGHSHGNMKAFFSGTDEDTWDNWTLHNDKDFFFASVHSTKKENKTCFRTFWKGASFDLKESPVEIHDEYLIKDQVQAALANMTKCAPIPSSYNPPAYASGYYSSEQGLLEMDYEEPYTQWGTTQKKYGQSTQMYGKSETSGTTSGQANPVSPKPKGKTPSKMSSKASKKKR